MTVPHWRRSDAPQRMECEVAIIGGGISGISMALHLQRQDVHAMVIERHGVASGASGRNAGFLMRGAADNYAACVDQYGRERAAQLWRLTEQNLESVREEGVESLESYKRVPSCLLALSQKEAEQIERSHQLLRADGFEVDLVDSGDDAPWRSGKPIVGLVNPNDAAVNPTDFLALLASKLDSPTIEHEEVHDVDLAERDGVLIHTASRTIRAKRAVICTNAYTRSLMPRLGALIEPNRAQMLALEVDRRLLNYSYYANHGSEYFRQPSDAVLVVGGWRDKFLEAEQTDRDATTDQIQDGLEEFITALLMLDDLRVSSRWSGIMGFTPDHLPLAGPVEPSRRLWVCAGFNGHGMSMAFQTAQMTTKAMLDGSNGPFPPARFQVGEREADR